MELKIMASKIKELLQIDNINDLPKKLLCILEDEKYTDIFDRYIKIVGDLEIDYMQKCYQFWLADRGIGTKQQDYTPPSISKLVAKMANCKDGGTVYDCCCGSGSLTIAAWKNNNSLKFVCEELDSNVIPVLLFNLAIRGIDATVVHGDALKNEIYETWKLTRQNQYSIIKKINGFVHGYYDACISNPPYNIRWEPPIDSGLFGADERFSHCVIPPASNANYAFVLHCAARLKENGKAVMILPNGIQSANGIEKEIRRYLLENGLISSLIAMPDKMFESTSIPTCLLTLHNGRSDKQVFVVDARKEYCEEIRDQRGEGSKSHAMRVYHKAMKVFSSDNITAIVNAVSEKNDIGGFSKLIAINDIRDQDWIISPSRYIESKEEPSVHRPYIDIVRELNNIAKEKGAVKITMNETLAKRIGFAEIAEAVQNDGEIVDGINNGLIKILGLEPLEKSKYITVSKKAGEIKIENMSKDSVSSIFAIFMPIFKQHIYYLNNRENELLMELRDAVLPELMSGKISI